MRHNFPCTDPYWFPSPPGPPSMPGWNLKIPGSKVILRPRGGVPRRASASSCALPGDDRLRRAVVSQHGDTCCARPHIHETQRYGQRQQRQNGRSREKTARCSTIIIVNAPIRPEIDGRIERSRSVNKGRSTARDSQHERGHSHPILALIPRIIASNRA